MPAVEKPEMEGNQAKMEEALKDWMRRKIAELEEERSPSPPGRGLG